MSRLHVWLIVGIAVTVIATALYAQGEEVSPRWFTSIGLAVGVVLTASQLFNLWVWRWNLLQGWLIKRPHLWGEWQLFLRPLWVSSDTGRRPGPLPATLSVKQTYMGVHARFHSNESRGDLICGQILRGEDGAYRLAGIYRNEPRLEFRDHSPIHMGAFLLEIEGTPNHPTRLAGSYWTDRQTKGEIEAVRQSR